MVVFDVLVFFPVAEESPAAFIIEVYGTARSCREIGDTELASSDSADDKPIHDRSEFLGKVKR